jgi:hypothetical protein
MKSGQEIVNFIDRSMAWAMERPELYGLDAADLESQFFLLDQIRQFAVVNGEDHRNTRSQYGDYLGEQGYGPRRFTTDESTLPILLTDEKVDKFRQFIEFWKGYLAWRDAR